MNGNRLMTCKEALTAIADNNPLVIESRKHGIVANWFTARDKDVFAAWLRGRMEAGAYPEHAYNFMWRCWTQPPTEEQRRTMPWLRSTRIKPKNAANG